LVASVNATAGPVPEGLLCSGVGEWARRAPEKTAVVAVDGSLSFGELWGRACGVGRRLRGLGVGPNQLVAVGLPKGRAQIVAALGVMLAGGAYLPVDPELPTDRQDYLLDHGQARIVLTPPGEEVREWPEGVRRLTVDLEEPLPADQVPPEQVQTPSDLAYVIYTSGSTGLPKGVAVSHRAALNTCVDMVERFGIGPDDAVLGLSSLSFDLSVFDVFGVLGAGGRLVLPRAGSSRDPGHWLELVCRERVSVWNSVPALMAMLVEHAAGSGGRLPVRLALLSGDWIPVDLPDRIRGLGAEGAQVVSLGGATEAAIWSIHYPVGEVDPGWDSVPYGRPLRNQRFHVLNERWQECPVFVPGELFIAGVGLAEGYWRDPERTAASFVVHPGSGERLYRTGDLGRWLPSGDIEFLGREDFQVKVGGFRIELGEIEAAVAGCPGVKAAVAAALGERHHRRLVGYIVPDDGPHDDLVAKVRAHAQEGLPSYMVPPTWTLLDQIPLSANGKVDRTALPDPSTASASRDDTPAATRLETSILGVVTARSGRGRIGVLDNFFELGLDSLTLTRIYRDLRDELGLDFPITTLFGEPNVRRLATHLAGSDTGSGPAQDAHDRARLRRRARARRAK
jgi:amino acid adenylation domain-containing protein